MRQPLSISDMQEKKIGLGEDSDPISVCFESFVALGVLDGMGGAGGAECISDFGDSHTKAYVGSRIIRDAIEKQIKQLNELPNPKDLVDLLNCTILTRYQEEKEKYPPKSKGGLRSSLIKEYPTTLAMAFVSLSGDHYNIDSFWAGDSRNFIWDMNGLFQISLDDIRGKLDPLQNLHEDAPMTNCLQADAPFRINHKRIDSKPIVDKFIVLSATDGCFGYYPSPMDFEKILSDSLKYSNSLNEWKERLNEAFAYVTADDFSFSLAAFGFKDFKDIKKLLSRSKKGSFASYIYHRNEYESKVRKKQTLERELKDLAFELEDEIKSLWSTYKETYLKYMTTDEEG